MSRDKHKNKTEGRRKIGQNPSSTPGTIGNDKNVPEFKQFGESGIHK